MSDLPLDKWREQACRDDWHQTFVGSDIRQMLAEIERLRFEKQDAAVAMMAEVERLCAERDAILVEKQRWNMECEGYRARAEMFGVQVERLKAALQEAQEEYFPHKDAEIERWRQMHDDVLRRNRFLESEIDHQNAVIAILKGEVAILRAALSSYMAWHGPVVLR